LAGILALVGGEAVDGPLDNEQGVDAADRFEGHGRDDQVGLALGLLAGAGGSACTIEGGKAAIGVGLKYAAEVFQMPLRVLAPPIAGIVKHRRRRGRSAEGAVIADIDPTSADIALALGQDRHGGVVAVQTFGGQDVGFP